MSNNNNLFFGPMENIENPKNYRPQLNQPKKNTRKNTNKNTNKNTKKNSNTRLPKYNKNKNKTTLKNKPKGPPFALMTQNEMKEVTKSMKNFNYYM